MYQQPPIGAVFLMATDKNRIQAYIDDDLLKRLKAYATAHRLSMSHAVEKLLIESESLAHPSSDGDPSATPVESEGESPRRTYQDALTQIREWAVYNVYNPGRYQRITYKEMARNLNFCYPPPEGEKRWTPEMVSAIIQRKGKL